MYNVARRKRRKTQISADKKICVNPKNLRHLRAKSKKR